MVATGLAPLVLRRAVGFERLVVNNEIAGFQYSTLGTGYAVLLALALVAVWGNFRDAQRIVDIEASSFVNIFALAEALPDAERDAVRAALRAYIDALIGDEWPAMQQTASWRLGRSSICGRPSCRCRSRTGAPSRLTITWACAETQ